MKTCEVLRKWENKDFLPIYVSMFYTGKMRFLVIPYYALEDNIELCNQTQQKGM